MTNRFFATILVGSDMLTVGATNVLAAPCLMVTLTGTQSGPPIGDGRAGSGTLVRYGEDANNCNDVRLQFDTGRGTLIRLSQVGVLPAHLNAVFFTHMHSDHSEGFPEMMQLRWNFNSGGPKVDVVCSNDAKSPLGHILSCRKFAAHTHLAPPLGALRHGPYTIPGGPLTEDDYKKVVEASGFKGNVIVGTELVTLRLPVK